MKKKMLSVSLVLLLCAGMLPWGQRVFAATPGTGGQTLTGDYVAIVNTNTDPAAKQSTGAIVFDESGGTASSAMAKQSAQAEQNLFAEPADMLLQGAEPAGHSRSARRGDYAKGETLTLRGKSYVCIGAGDHCFIWMEAGMKVGYDAAGKTDKAAAEMIYVYEGEPYAVLMAMCENKFPNADGTGKLSILLEDTGGSSGYFAAETELTAIHIQTPAVGSYTGGQFANKNGLLVHEGQHALFRFITCKENGGAAYENSWLNEGLAVAAMDYTWGGTDDGWISLINENMLLRNGASLFYASYRDSAALDYGIQYAFVRYLSNRLAGGVYSPMKFFNAVYKTPIANHTPAQFVNAVIQTYAPGSSLRFETLLPDFYVALSAHEANAQYGFGEDTIPRQYITNYPVYMGKSGQAEQLPGTGAIIIKTVGGSFTVPTNAGKDIKFIAFNKSNKPAPAKGKGTVAEPYLLESPSDLNFLSLYPSACFQLNQDISLDASKPFLTVTSFTGTLDGNGKTINNLTQPLVDVSRGSIKNLTINALFTDEYSLDTGVFANSNYGVIRGCGVKGTVNARMTGGNEFLPNCFGGIVGSNEMGAEVLECYSTASVTLNVSNNNAKVGGLLGRNKGRLWDSYSAGIIHVTQPDTNRQLDVGGAVGSLRPAMSPGPSHKNVYSTANITVIANPWQKNVGNLIGDIGEFGTGNSTQACYAQHIVDGPFHATGNGSAALNTAIQKTKADMEQQSTYVGWAFGGVWKMPSPAGPPVFVSAADIQGEITVNLHQSSYYIGETLYLYNSMLTLNGVSVPLTEDLLTTPFSSATPGTKTLSGLYQGKAFTFTVEVNTPGKVEGLIVSKGATKTKYVEGQSFEPTGVKLMATLDGKQYRYITSGFTYDLKAPLTVGNTKVTYTYCGVTVSEAITVTAKVVGALRVISPLAKLSYLHNDKLDFTELLLQMQYTDGTFSAVFGPDTMGDAPKNIQWYLQADGGSPEVIDANTYQLKTADHEKLLYARQGPSGPKVKVGVLTVKPLMKMDDEVFVVTQGVEAYPFSEQPKNTQNYIAKLKAGASYDNSEITNLTLPDSSKGNQEFRFTVKFESVKTVTLPFILTDRDNGSTLEVHMTFVVQPPSAECEARSVAISTGFGQPAYMGLITDSTITFKIPSGADRAQLIYVNPAWSQSATANKINGDKVCTGSKPDDLVITSQDTKHTKTYTIVLEEIAAANKLGTPAGLQWTDSTGNASWSAVAGATGYVVSLHQYDQGSSPAEKVNIVTGTTFDFSPELQGKTGDYEFHVIATCAGKLDSDAASSATKPFAPTPAVTLVKVEPETANVFKGGTQQFTALVSGVSNPNKAVAWSVKGLTDPSVKISDTGLLTVGAEAMMTELTVVATSVQTPAVLGEATVTVGDAPQLAAPAALAWTWTGGNVPTTIQAGWGDVSGAAGYAITLLKDGAPLGSARNVAASERKFDFKDEILSAGGGSYRFSVKALGDETARDSEETSSTEHAYAPPATVDRVVVTSEGVSVAKGGSLQFSASVEGTNGPSQVVTWSVAGGVAGTLIDASGLLAVAAGETAASLTVTAISNADSTKSAALTVQVTVPPPVVTGVAVSPATVSLKVGDVQQFTAAVAGTDLTNPAVTWSLEGAVASATVLDGSGTLTIAMEETAKSLTVKAVSQQDPSKSGTAAVTVTALPVLPAPTGLTWTGAVASWDAVADASSYTVQLYRNGAVQGNPITGLTTTTTDFTADITLTGSYTFTVVAVGDDSNHASSIPAQSNIYAYKAAPIVTGVTVSPATNVSVTKGETLQFTAVVNGTDEPSQAVTWSVSGNIQAATAIDATGRLTVAPDETATTVTVMAVSDVNGTKSASVAVTVVAPIPAVTSVTIAPTAPITLKIGETQQFTATVEGKHNPPTTVAWSVQGQSSAATTVSIDGLLTVAMDEAAATITVKAVSTYDGAKSAAVAVTVLGPVEILQDEIAALPLPDQVKDNDAAQIAKAKAGFEALSDPQKNRLPAVSRKALSDTIGALGHIEMIIQANNSGLSANQLGLVVTAAEIKGNDKITVTLTAKQGAANDAQALLVAYAQQNNVDLGASYDIVLDKKVGNSGKQSITDTEQLALALSIPVQEQGKASYAILRVHAGKVDRLEAQAEGNTLLFQSGRFSAYAITYAKPAPPAQPEVPTTPSHPADATPAASSPTSKPNRGTSQSGKAFAGTSKFAQSTSQSKAVSSSQSSTQSTPPQNATSASVSQPPDSSSVQAPAAAQPFTKSAAFRIVLALLGTAAVLGVGALLGIKLKKKTGDKKRKR